MRENNNYFNYNDFVVPKLNEKLYPKKKDIQPHDEHIIFRHSNKAISNVYFNYYIPKNAVVELFEKISDEKYYNLLFGVSHEMINGHTSKIIYDFYNIFSKNSTNETFDLNNTNITSIKLPEIFNLNTEKILQTLEEVKKALPDQLNTADANPILFKVNKFNELFNPLDKCLQKEIDSFNLYINKISEDISNISLILQGDMMLNDKYYNILLKLSKNLVPNNWKKSNLYQDLSIEKWLNKFKYIYKTMNNWINDGTLPVYDLSTFINTKLFIITLPIYFQKKLQENNTVSSDKILIEYQLTKYEKIEEINDTILERIKTQNENKDFILIKGLILKQFESFYEKESKVYQENIEKKEMEELPIILVTYSINSFENIKEMQINIEEDNNDDEDEEDIINKNISSKKLQINVEKSLSKFESESQVKEYEDEEYDQVPDEISEISGKLKKSKFIHSKTAYYKDKTSQKTSVNLVQKYKYFTLKKYCKINVPIVEINENDIYGIDEPLGYIELKFKCANDKQEEYFINNKIHIDIDN